MGGESRHHAGAMTTVCAIKIALPVADDTLYVVMFGNETALAKDVRLIGEIEYVDAPNQEQQQQVDTFVVAADNFRSAFMRLRSN